MDEAKAVLWNDWIDRTLLADIRSADTPDPVRMIDDSGDELERTSAFDTFRYGRNGVDCLYILYVIREHADTLAALSPTDIIPLYIGETNKITNRLLQHFNNITAALPIEDWEGDDSWGSFSKYDHMAAVYERFERPLYAWILDVDELDTGPYGYPTYRQELEAKLVGLVHAQDRFERTLANREFVPNRILREIGRAGPDWVANAQLPTDAKTTSQKPVKRPSKSKAELWHHWVDETILTDIHSPDVEDPIPLFETDADRCVQVTDEGVLKRTDAIDARIRREGQKCLQGTRVPADHPDGLLYVMYQIEGNQTPTNSDDIRPRYIGKAEASGKKNELSANFTEIAKDSDATRSFARWGDGDYWHVGELSNTLFGESDKKSAWASELFESGTRRLQEPTYLWIRAWEERTHPGPYGYDAYLAEAEPLLIGLAYDAYPETLCNHDGVPDSSVFNTREHRFEPAPVPPERRSS